MGFELQIAAQVNKLQRSFNFVSTCQLKFENANLNALVTQCIVLVYLHQFPCAGFLVPPCLRSLACTGLLEPVCLRRIASASLLAPVWFLLYLMWQIDINSDFFRYNLIIYMSELSRKRQKEKLKVKRWQVCATILYNCHFYCLFIGLDVTYLTIFTFLKQQFTVGNSM